MSDERRRSPRVEIAGRLAGHSKQGDAPIRVRNFSLGGMAIETAAAFEPGEVHTFTVTLGDGALLELRGRVVRRRSLAAPGEPPLFDLGIQFVDDDDPATPGAVLDSLRKE
jgi:hypothetical protein